MGANKKFSQCSLILDHLHVYGSITPMVALQQYQCMRLGARILELKNRGHNIQSSIVKDNGKQYAEYRLIKQGLN